MAKRKGSREKKKKSVNYDPIYEDSNVAPDKALYKLLKSVVKQHYPELVESKCKILLAWRSNWKSDANGRVYFGQTMILNELKRGVTGYDVVIVLNRDIWRESSFTDDMREAAMDERLAYIQVAKESNGDLKKDVMDRCLFRMRRADVVTHCEVIKRHGPWHEGIQEMLEAISESQAHPLLIPLQSNKGEEEEDLPPPAKKVSRPLNKPAKAQA